MILKDSRCDRPLSPEAARDLAERFVLMTRDLLARYRLAEQRDGMEREASDVLARVRDRRRQLWEKAQTLMANGVAIEDATARAGLEMNMSGGDALVAFSAEQRRQHQLDAARRNLEILDAAAAGKSNAEIGEMVGFQPGSVSNFLRRAIRGGGGSIVKARERIEARIAEIEGEDAPPAAAEAAPPRPAMLFAADSALSSDDPILLGLDLWVEQLDAMRDLAEDDPRNEMHSGRAKKLMETVVETPSLTALGIAAKLRAAWPIWQMMPERWEPWALLQSAMKDAERLAGRVPQLAIADRFPDAFAPRTGDPEPPAPAERPDGLIH